MQLDLNHLLEEILTWKNIVKNKEERIEGLQNEIEECKQHIEHLKNSNTTLLQEVAHQNSIISSLYQSLSIIDKTEADKKALIEEIAKLKINFKEQEKLHLEENYKLQKSIEKLQTDGKGEIEKKITDIKNEVSTELEKCAIDIREKENCIMILKDEIMKLKDDKEQEILKIQIECEEKLGRIKRKLSKNKGTHHNDFKSNDFFRQKYIEKERETKEETSKLKKEIEDLKREVDLLKSNRSFNASTQQDDLFQREQFYMADISNEDLPPKRPKMNVEDDAQSDRTSRFNNASRSESDFTVCKFSCSNMKKQLGSAISFKKKLFNTDTNYFNK